MKAIRIHETGDAGVLRLEEVPDPEAAPGTVVVRVEAAGLNFIDVYFRTGAYPAKLPWIPGLEGAGTVVSVGEGVSEPVVGERVAWSTTPGSYAELCAVPADRLVPVPDGVATNDAAAVMLQGMTAHYLATSTWPLRSFETCLVHAAAGGVGLLLCQMAKHRGARVIGTVSTEAKARLARDVGADEVILYREEDFQEAVGRITGRQGVDVVYDSVGKTTFEKSLASLRPRGMLVLYGQSSGVVPLIDPQRLSEGGSLFFTRPTLFHYVADRSELLGRARDVFAGILDGSLRVRIDRTLPLAEAAEAHRALEGRQTTGKVLLLPA